VIHLKQKLRNYFPSFVVYLSYFKALFENEIELRLLFWLCDRQLTSIDVGAFTGIYSIGAWFHSKNVIAVEPQRKYAEALRNSMPNRVSVVEAALSNCSGSGLLKMQAPEGGSMSRLDDPSWQMTGWVAVPVRLMRMDELDRGHIGFVKIDAEGYELEIAEGACQIIKSDRPIFLIEAEERHRSGSVVRLVRFFEKCNYECHFVYRNEVRPIQEFEAEKHQNSNLTTGGRRKDFADYINNFIFVPQERAVNLPRTVPSAWRAVYETWIGWYRN
jgi:FkbM family methyltransferase